MIYSLLYERVYQYVPLELNVYLLQELSSIILLLSFYYYYYFSIAIIDLLI